MRKLSTDKRAAILGALFEGVSINATSRMCGASKITVLRLLADAGEFSAQYHDLMIRDVASARVQLDEIWGFCGCKDKAKEAGAQGYGSLWTWTGMDADTKLCISYLVGNRTGEEARIFLADLATRLRHRIQLTSDGLAAYEDAVERAFGGAVDYAMLVKVYGTVSTTDERRYSPPECTGCKKTPKSGSPDPAYISTSYIERQNLTMRMQIRRLTRLTNAFSKKVENHAYAVALHYMHYNFIRKHMTLKTTPAAAAGLAARPLTVLDLVRMIEDEERKIGGRLTDYLASPDLPPE